MSFFCRSPVFALLLAAVQPGSSVRVYFGNFAKTFFPWFLNRLIHLSLFSPPFFLRSSDRFFTIRQNVCLRLPSAVRTNPSLSLIVPPPLKFWVCVNILPIDRFLFLRYLFLGYKAFFPPSPFPFPPNPAIPHSFLPLVFCHSHSGSFRFFYFPPDSFGSKSLPGTSIVRFKPRSVRPSNLVPLSLDPSICSSQVNHPRAC